MKLGSAIGKQYYDRNIRAYTNYFWSRMSDKQYKLMGKLVRVLVHRNIKINLVYLVVKNESN